MSNVHDLQTDVWRNQDENCSGSFHGIQDGETLGIGHWRQLTPIGFHFLLDADPMDASTSVNLYSRPTKYVCRLTGRRCIGFFQVQGFI